MQIKDHRYSIRQILLIILAAIVIPVVLMLVFLCRYTQYRLRHEVTSSYRTAMQTQIDHVDGWIRQDENFLLTLYHSDMNVSYLKRDPENQDRANYVYHIRQQFQNRQLEGSSCEWYFVLFDDQRHAAFSYSGQENAAERMEVETYLNHLKLGEERNSINWEPVEIGGRYYFLRALTQDGFGIGCMVSVDAVMKRVAMREDPDAFLIAADADGNPLNAADRVREHQIALSGDTAGGEVYYFTGDRDEFLMIQVPFSGLKGSLFYCIRDHAVLGNLAVLNQIVEIVAVLTAVLLSAAAVAVYQIWLVPMNHLKEVIGRIRDGDMDQKIGYGRVAQEFDEIYQLFNEMMERIGALKIKSYEEELQKKNYQLQFYSLQLKPHFYLNSLKCMYALAQKEDFKKIQEMLLNLSDYFKYITYDSQGTITLEEELRHTSTYLQIRQAGVIHPIDCTVSIDNRARKLPVLGLVIQTFVENSIKYAVREDEQLKVNVKVSLLEQNGRKYMDITVTDNGPGYGWDVIRIVNREETDQWNGHIGLTNLRNRLKLVYGEDAFMAISNTQEGGAYSEVMFCVKEEENESVSGG